MEKSRLIEILSDWNFWEKEINAGIERKTYVEKVKNALKSGQVATIVGARRSGKSTIMKQYLKEMVKSGLNKKNTLFVNFEDPRFGAELSLDLMQQIYDAYIEFLGPEGKPYVFLDEVQHIKGWEKFARALHERDAANLIVSGSSSKLLSEEFGTALTGRHITIHVFPLNFPEFLVFKGIEIKSKVDMISKRHVLMRLLREYMEYGAFPKVVLSEEKNPILRDYYDDILSKDIIVKHSIKSQEKLIALSKYYITNISSPVSFNSIKGFLDIPINTVERFSYYLSYSYLFFFVKKHAYSLKEQEKNPRKVYCIDAGLRNAISFRFSEDAGKLAENIVFLELTRRGQEIYYWKDERQRETDFVIKKGQKIERAIQVCWSFDDAKTKKREIEGLAKAMDEFGLEKGFVITGEFEGEDVMDGRKIVYVPLWKWLLGNGNQNL